MQTTCLVFLFLFGLAFSQIDLITDPGLFSLMNPCASSSEWNFRSNFVWNDTTLYANPQCAAAFEIPGVLIPGISKGNQTNINKASIPPLPMVTNPMNGITYSAGIVDMNSACRAALWAPFTITNTPSSLMISLQLWVRSNALIQQFLFPSGSFIPGASELQYLQEPDGLLQEDLIDFPPLVEETNQVRIDILLPDSKGEFWDQAFTLNSSQIAVNIPIGNWTDGNVVPAEGTNNTWMPITFDATPYIRDPGTYALRVASAQSQIGVSWGISNVHVMVNYTIARSVRDISLYQTRSISHEITGTMTRVVPPRKSRW